MRDTFHLSVAGGHGVDTTYIWPGISIMFPSSPLQPPGGAARRWEMMNRKWKLFRVRMNLAPHD